MRIATITLLLSVLCVLCRAADPALDGIAAVVNQDVITYSQVRAQCDPEEVRLRDTLKGDALLRAIKTVRTSALDRLIDRQLYIQEYRRVGPSLIVGWTGEQIKAASEGRFDGDRRQWLDRVKQKAHINRAFGTLP